MQVVQPFKTMVIVSILFCIGCFQYVLAQDEDELLLQADQCNSESILENDHMQFVPEDWFVRGSGDAAEYRRAIQKIESDEGVFSYKLVPELIKLGLISLENSEPAESSMLFERALYVIRANDGLYSEKQMAVLDLMITSNSVNNDWEKVANSYDLMSWLYKRNYEENDPRQLQTVKRLRRWYMEAYNKDTGRTLEELFTNSENLYEQGIRIMWECTNGNDRETMCFWHKSCCAGNDTKQGLCPIELKNLHSRL